VLGHLSPALRGEVALAQHAKWIMTASFLRQTSTTFLTDISLSMRLVVFPPGENIISMGDPVEAMYIVERGVVGGKGRVFNRGTVFGEEVVSVDTLYKSEYICRSLTFCDLHKLSASDLHDIFRRFPEMRLKLRLTMVKNSIKEGLFTFAHAFKTAARGFEVGEVRTATGRGHSAAAADRMARLMVRELWLAGKLNGPPGLQRPQGQELEEQKSELKEEMNRAFAERGADGDGGAAAALAAAEMDAHTMAHGMVHENVSATLDGVADANTHLLTLVKQMAIKMEVQERHIKRVEDALLKIEGGHSGGHSGESVGEVGEGRDERPARDGIAFGG